MTASALNRLYYYYYYYYYIIIIIILLLLLLLLLLYYMIIIIIIIISFALTKFWQLFPCRLVLLQVQFCDTLRW